MAEQFARSVEHGLRLAKRIYYGKDHTAAPTAPPPKAPAMERSISSSKADAAAAAYLPAAPMVYAAISDPSTVDNPDILSYQPYVHGMCDPPALIPLQMHAIAMEIECCLDTAFVALSGTWRVHCVTATKSCDCRVAVPMGDQVSRLM